MKVELSKEQVDALARALVAYSVLTRVQPVEMDAPPWGYAQCANDVQTLSDLRADLIAYK